MTIFNTFLKERGVLLADGATGTNYFALGLETGYPPELWNIENPQAVLSVHQQFLDAGSDIVLTNSFGGSALRLKLHSAQDRVVEVNKKAAQLAREAVDAHQSKTGRKALVAGSIGPTGELFAPLGALDHAAARDAFAEQAQALVDGGVDLLWIETISAFEEVDAALEAALGTGLEVAATMTFDTAGKSMMGIAPEDYARHLSCDNHGDGQGGVVALGANCGIGPGELLDSVLLMRNATTLPIIAKGNCGIPQYDDGKIKYQGTVELMAKYALLARDAGAKVIGGCCGTTSEHIGAMRQALDTETSAEEISLAKVEEVFGKTWIDRTDADKAPSAGRSRSRRQRSENQKTES